jgi:hypothetical protein
MYKDNSMKNIHYLQHLHNYKQKKDNNKTFMYFLHKFVY